MSQYLLRVLPLCMLLFAAVGAEMAEFPNLNASLPLAQQLVNLTVVFAIPRRDSVFISGNTSTGFTGYHGLTLNAVIADSGMVLVEQEISAASIAATRDLYEACALDISKGLLDMCIGDFWDTPELRSWSGFTTPLQNEEFYVITRFQVSGSGIWNIFIPFTPALWGYMTLTGFIIALCMVACEGDRNENDFPEGTTLVWRLLQSMWHALYAFFGGGQSYTPATSAGKLVNFAWAFFILVAVASYTANLAALLSVVNTQTPVANWADAVTQGYDVCIHESTLPAKTLERPVAALRTFATDDEMFKMFHDGKSAFSSTCIVGTTSVIRLARQQGYNPPIGCDMTFVGPPVVSYAVAWPVVNDLSQPLSYWISTYRLDGQLAQFYSSAYPPLICASNGPPPPNPKLDTKEMVGVFYGSLVFLGLAVVFKAFDFVAARRKKVAQGAGARPVESGGDEDDDGGEGELDKSARLNKTLKEIERLLHEATNDDDDNAQPSTTTAPAPLAAPPAGQTAEPTAKAPSGPHRPPPLSYMPDKGNIGAPSSAAAIPGAIITPHTNVAPETTASLPTMPVQRPPVVGQA